MMRSTDECEMSRSCHSATSSSAACRLPRSTRASPRELLRLHRVALVRHRARALLLALAERLLGLAHLGALQVPDLERERLDRRAERRARVQHFGVAVARRAPASRAPAASPRCSHTYCSTHGSTFEYVPTAPDSLPTAIASRARSSRSRSRRTCMRPQRELHAERRRLGVDAVRAADHRRVAELARPGRDRRLRARPRPARMRSSARVICSASAVSTTSLDVRP